MATEEKYYSEYTGRQIDNKFKVIEVTELPEVSQAEQEVLYVLRTIIPSTQQTIYVGYVCNNARTAWISMHGDATGIDIGYGLERGVHNEITINNLEVAETRWVRENFQNILTWDTTPRQNSNNPVTSGGVYNSVSALSGSISSLSSTVAGKQDKLVSTSNIKSLNGESLLGSGNINVVASLGGKKGALTTGAGLEWNGNELSVIGGASKTYYAGSGLNLVTGEGGALNTFEVDTNTIATKASVTALNNTLVNNYQLKLPSSTANKFLHTNNSNVLEWVSLTNLYVYKGSVNSYSDLPTNVTTTGWVYNVIDTGVNYASVYENNTLTWDALGGSGVVEWGSISGTLTNQTDLNSALANKQNKLPTTSTAGKVLKSTSTAGTVQWSDVGGVTSFGGKTGAITLGANLSMNGNQLSASVLEGVASIGGKTGVITLGANLSMSGNQLSAASMPANFLVSASQNSTNQKLVITNNNGGQTTFGYEAGNGLTRSNLNVFSVDFTAVQPLLVWTGENQNIKLVNGVSLGGTGNIISGMWQYNNLASFPDPDDPLERIYVNEHTIYIDRANNEGYRWDATAHEYIKLYDAALTAGLGINITANRIRAVGVEYKKSDGTPYDNALKFAKMTKEQYNNLAVKNSDTFYMIVG